MAADPVLIVGAGPAGLILAHELLRRGVAVRLLEKRDGPTHTTRAFTLHARTMEMFEHIGVAHRIEEVSLPCPGNVYHFQGLPESECPRTDFRSLPSRYAFYYKLNQNDFEQVLREHLRAHYGLGPEYGCEVTGVAPGDDSVRVSFRDRSGGREGTISASWVVGCDGAHSAVRESAGIAFPGQRVGVMAMMDVEVREFPHDDSWVNYFIGQNLFMLVTKLPGPYWRVYLSDAGAMTEAENPRASFQAVADAIGIGMKLGEPHWASQWEIHNNIAESYRRGRVLLCGDASHVHSPAGGQGMNGCMQDAFNLGWKLAAVVHGAADATLLDSYERERKPIGEQITAGAKATHEIVMAFGKGLGDRIAITRTPGWQEQTIRVISGLAHNYRGVVETPEGASAVDGPQAGDRAPDAELVREPRKRVFDLFRHPRFTLLAFPGAGGASEAKAACDAIEVRHPDRVQACLIAPSATSGFDADHWAPDAAGEARRAYGVGASEGRLVLVRPDLYVAANCGPADGPRLAPFLDRWLRPAAG